MKINSESLSFKQKLNDGCLKLRHLFIFIELFLIFLVSGNKLLAGTENKTEIQTRMPATFVEEVMIVPLVDYTFSNENLFPEDDAGILKNVREKISSWEESEEFAQRWNLESTGIYKTPPRHDKQKFVTSKFLRYADKRLSGEMKKAEEGSTLYRVGKIEKNLRPNTQVPINKYVSLKFKARVLQGKAIVEVKNPWVEFYATAAVNRRARIVGRKEVKNTGISTGVEYGIDDEQTLAYVDQQITKEIKARISSSRYGNTNIFGNDADRKVEVVASFPFNF